jgi:hypothetical protein
MLPIQDDLVFVDFGLSGNKKMNNVGLYGMIDLKFILYGESNPFQCKLTRLLTILRQLFIRTSDIDWEGNLDLSL